MNVEEIREYAIQKEEVTEGFPFGPEVLVIKVQNKIFILLALDADPLQFNVKCNPEKAIELREMYPTAVLPGYHMNKTHWNTILVDGTLSRKQLCEMIDHSYSLIYKKPKK